MLRQYEQRQQERPDHRSQDIYRSDNICLFTGEVFDEEGVTVVFVVVEQPTDYDERVAAARDDGDDPDCDTQNNAVKQVEHRRDTVTKWMTDANHRSVATVLK